jgi:hypothetical protein
VNVQEFYSGRTASYSKVILGFLQFFPTLMLRSYVGIVNSHLIINPRFPTIHFHLPPFYSINTFMSLRDYLKRLEIVIFFS